MSDRHSCVGCGKIAPETDTNYTLISAQHGWRVARRQTPEGRYVVEWRCPSCWRAYKAALQAEGVSTSPSQPPPPRRPSSGSMQSPSPSRRTSAEMPSPAGPTRPSSGGMPSPAPPSRRR